MRVQRSSNANGTSVDYGYDSLNRISTATGNVSGARAATGTTTYGYDAVGNLDTYIYPNGVSHQYVYNNLNRLTTLSVLGSESSVLASFTYTLGAAGNRTNVTELSARKADYTYDDLYRLQSETITGDPLTANNGRINYTYDAVGNRLNRTSTVAAIPNQTSSVDANDRLAIDAYDSNGNTTASAGKTYVYDFENRIKSVNSGQNVFVYDGDGNRVAKTVGGVTTKFLVDTNNPTRYAQVVEEIVGSDVQRVYEHGHSLISQNQLLNANWVTSFYSYDGHGSVRFLTNSARVITDTYTYDAFGNLINRTGNTANDYLYAGEQLDAALGAYYLRARYMNPASGRFLSSDSFEGSTSEPMSLHKYAYVTDDPINRVDPSGHFGIIATRLAVFAILATILAASVLSYRPIMTAIHGRSSAGPESIIEVEHQPIIVDGSGWNDALVSVAETQAINFWKIQAGIRVVTLPAKTIAPCYNGDCQLSNLKDKVPTYDALKARLGEVGVINKHVTFYVDSMFDSKAGVVPGYTVPRNGSHSGYSLIGINDINEAAYNLKHEWGHTFGLTHTDESGLMYPTQNLFFGGEYLRDEQRAKARQGAEERYKK